jgi:hypothetical protein
MVTLVCAISVEITAEAATPRRVKAVQVSVIYRYNFRRVVAGNMPGLLQKAGSR